MTVTTVSAWRTAVEPATSVGPTRVVFTRVSALPETRTLTLRDGRRLAWCEYGVPNGPALFYFHGFPV